MRFTPTPEQQQLGELVQRFLAEQYGLEARRKILESEAGWSPRTWGAMAELGLLGLQAPEAHGGMAPAVVETLLTATAMGKAMLLEPYLPSAIVATTLLRELSGAVADDLIPKLVAGSTIAVPALLEPGARRRLERVETAAHPAGEGYSLTGNKAVVLHAPIADVLLVSARTPGADGLSVFAVARGAAGVTLVPYRTFDGRLAAEVHLADAPGALVGEAGAALPALTAAEDVGQAALCAEAVGALQATLDTTIEYTKARKQFGVPIAKFQALQHQMADMLMHVEQARSMSYLAAMHAAEPAGPEKRRALAAAAVVIGNACRFVGQRAVQLHGGMGVADETPVSHYFRRLTATSISLGETDFHVKDFIAAGAPAEAR